MINGGSRVRSAKVSARVGREAMLRKALLGSTALIGIGFAATPAQAQRAGVQTNGVPISCLLVAWDADLADDGCGGSGTTTPLPAPPPPPPSSTVTNNSPYPSYGGSITGTGTYTDSTSLNGGVTVTDTQSAGITMTGVTIANAGGDASPEGYWQTAASGQSAVLYTAGTNSLVTNVEYGAALRMRAPNGNLILAISQFDSTSVTDVTGSYGVALSASTGSINMVDYGPVSGLRNVTAHGTGITGIYANAALSATLVLKEPTISGFSTGIHAMAGGSASVTTTGGTINANSYGIDASSDGGLVNVDSSSAIYAPHGISAASSGNVTVTTRAVIDTPFQGTGTAIYADSGGSVNVTTFGGIGINSYNGVAIDAVGGSGTNRITANATVRGSSGIVAGAGRILTTVQSSGSVQGMSSTGYGVRDSGGGSVVNNGVIASNGVGVQLSAGGSVTNNNVLTGNGGTAIELTGAAATTINLAAGSSTTGAISVSSSGATTTTVAGTLTGAYNAAGTSAVQTLTLAATGSLAGATFGGGNDSFTWTGGTIGGTVDGGAGTDSFISNRGAGNSGTLNLANIANFESFTQQSGTVTLTGAAATPGMTINAGTGTPAGTLTFSGSGLTGTINVNGAVIRATAAGAFGTGTINAVDPTIQYGATGTYSNDITLASTDTVNDPVRIQADAGVTATLTGVISQSGATPQPVIFDGAGTINLTRNNSWSGQTTISNGTVRETNTGIALGEGGILINAGAVLNFDNTTTNVGPAVDRGTYTGAGTILFTGIGSSGGAGWLFGGYTGTLALAQSAGGLVEVTNINVFSGPTDYSSNLGSLKVNAGGAFYIGQDSARFAAITGVGTIGGGQNGTGTLTVGVGDGSGSFAGTLVNRSAVSGVLALTKIGSGTQTLTGANSYTGATIISGGTLALGGTGTLASTSITNNATFDISGHTGGASILDLAGSGTTTLGANTLTLTNPTSTYSGSITGTGGIVKQGGGIWTLTGTSSTYSGGTTISTGTIVATTNASGGNSLGSGSVTVAAAASALNFTQSTAGTFANAVSGAGNVNVSGAGRITFSGTVGNTGGFYLAAQNAAATIAGTRSGGVTSVTGSGSVLTVTGTVVPGVTLAGSGSGLVNSGTITGTTAATISGSSNPTITNNAGGKIVGSSIGVSSSGGTINNYGLIGSGTLDGSGNYTAGGTRGVSASYGSITNYAGGQILGGSDAGIALTADLTSLVNNSGTISGAKGLTAVGGTTLNNLAGATIVGTAGSGVSSNAAVWSITNADTSRIVGSTTGITAGGFATIQNGGLIGAGTLSGGTSGTYSASGSQGIAATTGTLVNYAAGVIRGGASSSAISVSSDFEINNAGFIAADTGITASGRMTLSGAGDIVGTSYGISSTYDGSTIDNGGRILTGSVAGNALGGAATIGGFDAIRFAGGVIYNYAGALISGGSDGIFGNGSGSVNVYNSGTIAADNYAAIEFTQVGTVLNYSGGTITGGNRNTSATDTGTGIRLQQGGTVSNAIGASITATRAATNIGIYSLGAATITNNGTLSGSAAAILLSGTFNDSVSLGATSVTTGLIQLGAGDDTLTWAGGSFTSADGGAGTDTFKADLGTGSATLALTTLTGFEAQNLATGRLTVTGTGTAWPTWTMAAGTTLNFGATGAGNAVTLTTSGNAATVNGDNATVNVAAGSTVTAGNFGVRSTFANTLVHNDGTLNVSIGSAAYLSGPNARVENSGTITLTNPTAGFNLLYLDGAGSSIVNSGTINGPANGGYTTATYQGGTGSSFTNQIGGQINSSTGIYLASGATVINAGSITASLDNGVSVAGGSVTNSGTITANGTSGAWGILSNGVLTGSNSGSISAGSGVWLNATGSSTFGNTGTITGNQYGINGFAGSLAVTNSNAITATLLSGVRLAGGGSVTNSGTITGGSDATSGYAIEVAGGVATITNQSGGTLTGGAAGAIALNGANAVTVDLQAGSTTTGRIVATNGATRTLNVAGTFGGAYDASSGTGADTVNLYAGGTLGVVSLGDGGDLFNWYGGSFTSVDGGGGNFVDTVNVRLGSGSATVAATSLTNFEGQYLYSGTLTLTGAGSRSWNIGGATLNIGTAAANSGSVTVTGSGSLAVAVSGVDANVNVAAGGALSSASYYTVFSGYDRTHLTNAGTISTPANTAVYLNGADSTLVNSGSITGISGTGSYVPAVTLGGANGSLTNNAGGTITGRRGASLSGANASITNSGTITGTADNAASLFAGGTITNNLGGTLSATVGGGYGAFVTGGAGTVVNNGTITAVYGIDLSRVGVTHSVTNAGTITATEYGVLVENGAATVDNSGSITASSGSGVSLAASGGSVSNSGTIAGGTSTTTGYAVRVADGDATITNLSGGTLTGGAAGAVGLDGSGTIAIDLQSGSTTTGRIVSTGAGARTLNIASSFGDVYDASGGNGVDQVTLRTGGSLASADLGGGNDIFRYFGGSITGLVDGGGDTDTLIADFGAGNGTVSIANFANFEAFNFISGDATITGGSQPSGAEIHAGNGTPSTQTVTFTGTQNLTGDIYVEGATIRTNEAGGFGAGTIHMIDPVAAFGATGDYGNAISLEVASPAASNPSTLSADIGVVARLTGAITQGTGAGVDPVQPLVIAGQGTIVLTNTANNWTGTTTIDPDATLQGSSDTISGSDIVVNGTLVYSQPNSATVAKTILGIGTLNVSGLAAGETLTFSGAVTNFGGLTILDGSAVANTGTFVAAGYAVQLANGGSFTNSGTVNGFLSANGGADAAIVNSGTINGSVQNNGTAGLSFTNTLGGSVATGDYGVGSAPGTSLTVLNAGDIAGENGALWARGAGVTVTNSGRMIGGTITGATYDTSGNYAALRLALGGTVTNNGGLISGGQNGILVDAGTLTLTNAVSGTIEGANAINAYAAADITNAGTIAATANDYAIGLSAGGIIRNAGLIQGGTGVSDGVAINSTGELTLINQAGGQIDGARGAVLSFGALTADLQAGSTTGRVFVIDTVGASTATIGGTLTGRFDFGGGADTMTVLTSATIGTGVVLNGGAGIDAFVLDGAGTASLNIANVINFEGFTKNGTGSWSLTGATATPAAGWQVNAGTLVTNGGNSIGDAAVVTVAAGATLQLGATETIGALQGAGSVSLGARTLVLNGGGTDFAGSITGTGGVSFTGGGVSTLSGANSYTGNTELLSATLRLGASDVLSDASQLIVYPGTTLDLQGFSDTVASVLIGGTVNGTGTLTAATQTLSNATINANLGAGTLTQAGGVSTLNGTSAATTVTVAAGTLALGGANRLADTAALTVVSGATLSLGANSDTVASAALAGTVTGTGTLTAGSYTLDGAVVAVNLGTGTLTQASGTSVLGGTSAATVVDVTGGTLTLGGSNLLADTAALNVATGATLDLGGNSDKVASALLSGTLNGTGTLTAATTTLNGATVNANLGGGTLTQAGGSSVLNGSSAASDVVVQGGTLTLGGSNLLSDTANLLIASGGVFDIGAFDETVGQATIAGTLAGTGTLTASAFTINGGTVLAHLAGGPVSYAGDTTQYAPLDSASVNITSTLHLGASNVLRDDATVTVAAGGTLDMASFDDTIALLQLSGTLDGSGTLTATEYQLSGGTVNAHLGTGTLTQVSGSSTLNNTAAAGVVNVTGGTLNLGASNLLADNAALTIASGATLNLGANSDTVGTAAIAGTLNGSGTLTAATTTLDGATVNAKLGTGTLVQAGGSSTLNNSAASGTVNVTGGTLNLGGSNLLADTAALSVASGATLNLGANSDTVATAALSGTLNGSGTLTAATTTLNGATVNAKLGTGTLVQAGGSSTLNNSAAAGTVNVTGGTLNLGGSNLLADTAALNVAGGATFNLGANSDTVGTAVLAGTLAGTGTLTAASYQLTGATVNGNLGTGTLVQAGGTSALTGTSATSTVAIQSGTLRLGGSERLANTAVIGINTGGTFDLAGYTETVSGITNGASGGGTLALGAGRLVLSGNSDSAFSGAITGSGSIDKQGSGRLSLTGAFANTGRIDVSAGTLAFDGSSQGALRVQGGTLTGNGSFAGALTLASGTLAPGGQISGGAGQPIGSFTAASLAISGGSVLFDFGGSSFNFASDTIRVSGAATIAGATVQVNALAGAASDYRFNQLYTVVQANTLAGTFANGTDFATVANNPNLRWRLRYDLVANAVVLQVQKNVDFTAGVPAGDPNSVAVAQALSNSTQSNGSDSWSGTLNTLAAMSPAERNQAFQSFTGEGLSDISTVTIAANNLFGEVLRQRAGGSGDALVGTGYTTASLGDVRTTATAGNSFASSLAGASLAGSEGEGTGGAVWGQAYGGYQRQLDDPAHAGVETTTAGVAMGAELRGNGFAAGVAGGVAELDSSVDSRLTRVSGTQYQLGGYASYDSGGAFGSLSGSWYSGDYDSRRTLALGTARSLATGDIHSEGYAFGASAGYRADLGGGLRGAILASASKVHDVRDAFTETASGGLGLEVGRATRDLFVATGELRLSARVKAGGGFAMPYVSAGVRYNAGDLDTVGAMRFSGAPAGTGGFTVTGARLSPVLGTFGGGIDARASDTVRLGVSFETAYGDRTREGRASMRVKIGF
jgi:fibronectin-binding autotransporter adhesin